MIVTLCGSVRFERHFKEAKRELGLLGITVIDLSTYPSEAMPVSERGATLDENHDKVILDLVHLEKIIRSDAVLVVGTGYIGRSTAREVLWAAQLEKPVTSQWSQIRLITPIEDPPTYEALAWTSVAQNLRDRHHDHALVTAARRVLGDRR